MTCNLNPFFSLDADRGSEWAAPPVRKDFLAWAHLRLWLSVRLKRWLQTFCATRPDRDKVHNRSQRERAGAAQAGGLVRHLTTAAETRVGVD